MLPDRLSAQVQRSDLGVPCVGSEYESTIESRYFSCRRELSQPLMQRSRWLSQIGFDRGRYRSRWRRPASLSTEPRRALPDPSAKATITVREPQHDGPDRERESANARVARSSNGSSVDQTLTRREPSARDHRLARSAVGDGKQPLAHLVVDSDLLDCSPVLVAEVSRETRHERRPRWLASRPLRVRSQVGTSQAIEAASDFVEVSLHERRGFSATCSAELSTYSGRRAAFVIRDRCIVAVGTQSG